MTAAMIPFNVLKAKSKKAVGLQLYTVRKEMNKDLEGTLQKVAQIGYKEIELAGYRPGAFYGKSPKEFSNIASDLGLHIVSSHNGFSPDRAEKIIEDNVALGVQYTVQPYLGNTLRKNLDDYKKLAEQFNKYGELCNKAGLRFAYHNHNFEFIEMEGKIPYDLLLQETDTNLVGFEMDLYWIKKAGYEPLDYFSKYPGRFILWHVKDMDPKTGNYTEVGSGNTDFKSIFQQAQNSGMEHYFVELDNSVKPALESIKISFDYLNNSDFVQ